MAELLKLPEVARRLDISEKTARRMVKAGKLPAVFIGNAYRVSEEDIEAYLRGARVEPGKAPRRSSLEPSFWNGLEEERRAGWEAAAEEARRLRESGWAQMWRALSDWRASKKRGEADTARRKHLDEIGNILQEAYDVETALESAYLDASLTLAEGSEADIARNLQQESRATLQFYGELLGLVKSTRLSVSTRTAESEAPAESAAKEAPAEKRAHQIEEDSVAS